MRCWLMITSDRGIIIEHIEVAYAEISDLLKAKKGRTDFKIID